MEPLEPVRAGRTECEDRVGTTSLAAAEQRLLRDVVPERLAAQEMGAMVVPPVEQCAVSALLAPSVARRTAASEPSVVVVLPSAGPDPSLQAGRAAASRNGTPCVAATLAPPGRLVAQPAR